MTQTQRPPDSREERAPTEVGADAQWASEGDDPRAPRPLARRLFANEYVRAGAIFAAVLLVFFAPLFQDRTFSTFETIQNTMWPWVDEETAEREDFVVQFDHALAYGPRQVFIDDALGDGQFPMWNPLSFGGQPYFANSATGLAYPPRVALTLLLNPSWTHDAYVMLHLFAGALAMFAFMRSLKVGFEGAVLSGIAWAFSSWMLIWAHLEIAMAPLALLPVVLLLIRRWYDRRRFRYLPAAGLVMGLMWLGSQGELWLITALAVMGYAGFLTLRRLIDEWGDRSWLGRMSVAASPGATFGVALGLVAPSLLPFLQIAHRTPFGYNEAIVAGTSDWSSLFHLLWPPAAPPLALGSMLHEAYFVGTLALLCALMGLFLRRPGTGLGRGLIVLVGLYVLGTPVTWLGWHVIPMLNRLWTPTRLIFLFDLGLAVLVGVGLDHALRWLRERAPEPDGVSGAGWRDRVRRWWGRHPRRIAAGVAAIVIVVTAVQLVEFGRRANPDFPGREPEALYRETPAIEAIRENMAGVPGGGRLIPLETDDFLVIGGASNMALGLPAIGGYEPVVPADTERFWMTVGGTDPDVVETLQYQIAYLARFAAQDVRENLLRRSGVTTVYAPPEIVDVDEWQPELGPLEEVYSGPDGVVYEVVDPLPRAYLVDDAQWVPEPADSLRRFGERQYEVEQSVLLTGEGGVGPAPAPGRPQGEVEWRYDRVNEVGLTVTSDRPTWLVLLDTYDPNWRASVDGEQVTVQRANFQFRAVPIPAGTSEVTFEYRPRSLYRGAVVAALTVLGVLVFLVGCRTALGRRIAHRVEELGRA